MPLELLAGSQITLVLIGLLGLVLVTWALQAAEEAEDGQEALESFTGRAKEGTGGALNVALVVALTLIGWAATTFQTAGEAIVFLLSLAPDFPILSASVATIGLGAVGLSDVIVLEAVHFVVLSAVIVGLAVAYQADLGGIRT